MERWGRGNHGKSQSKRSPDKGNERLNMGSKRNIGGGEFSD